MDSYKATNRGLACGYDLANVSSQCSSLDNWRKIDKVLDSYLAESKSLKLKIKRSRVGTTLSFGLQTNPEFIARPVHKTCEQRITCTGQKSS